MSASSHVKNATGADYFLPDPSDGVTFSATSSGVYEITTGASGETNTLNAPTKVGLDISFNLITDGGGNRVITVTDGYDEFGSTDLTLGEQGGYVNLRSYKSSASAFVWRVLSYDNVTGPVVTLSTVVVDTVTVNTQLGLGANDGLIFGSVVNVNYNGTYMEGNTSSNAAWDACPVKMDPNYMSKAYEVEDDFISTPDVTNLWTAANVGTGTTAYDPAVAGGVVLMTCQATTDDACEQLTHKGAGFLLAAGKTIWYETRLKLVGDIQSEVSFGLVADGEDLTAVADVLPADGVSISNQDGSLANALTCSKDGTDTGAVAAINTMVSGTYVTYGLLIDGVTSVTPYIDGVAGTAATATINDDEAMAPYFLVRNGDGTTQQVLHVDYVRVVQLR